MIWKLLRQHISVAQLAGFFLANLCGMVIVLLGIQFYKDVLPVFTQGDSFMKKDYVIVSKQVSTLGSLVRNYLNLYNFGFAQSRNLPQLSEGVMGMMTLDVRLSGRGRTERMKGRIVGFSNRLNTILVPQAFMEWANATLGDGGETAPSRLIVEVDNPADDRIAKYFKQKGYETEGDKLDAGKTTWFLKMVVGIVLTVGLIISVLSFYLLMLSIYLLLQKNTKKLENLLMIGFSPAAVARPYQVLTVGLNAAVAAMGVLLVWMARDAYLDMLRRMVPDFQAGSLLPALLTAGGLFLLVSVLNVLAVRRKVESIWRKK